MVYYILYEVFELTEEQNEEKNEIEKLEMLGEAKVQSIANQCFIYLPQAKCKARGIVKGSRVFYSIKNTGLPPEPSIRPNWGKKKVGSLPESTPVVAEVKI